MPKLSVSQLSEATTLTESDIAAFLSNPSTVPVLKRTALQSLFKSITGLQNGTIAETDHLPIGRLGGLGAVKVKAGDLLDLMDLFGVRIPVDHKWALWLYGATTNMHNAGTLYLDHAMQFWELNDKEGYIDANGSSPFSTTAGLATMTGALAISRNPVLRGWVGPRGDTTLSRWVFGFTGPDRFIDLLGNTATRNFALFSYQSGRNQDNWFVEHQKGSSSSDTETLVDCGPQFPYEAGLMRFAEIAVRNGGTAIDFYLDGQLVYTATANIPTGDDVVSGGMWSSSSSSGGIRVGMLYVSEDPPVDKTPNDQAYEYYRIEILDNNADANFTGILEFELYEEQEGTNYALASNGGTATASMEDATLTAAKAIDGLLTSPNGWAANNLNVWPVWLQVQLDQPRVITHYQVGSYPSTTSTAARSPKDWIMYGSNDGSTWTELSRINNSTNWVFGVRRLFVM